MFLSRSGGVDVADSVDSERDNFFLRRAVEHERVAVRRYAIDQAASIGASDQISFRVESENANMDFITFEKERVLSISSDFENFTVIAGRDIQSARIVENDIPDILRAGFEVGSRAPGRFRVGLGGLCRFRLFEPVYLSVRSGGSINDAALVDDPRSEEHT